MTAGIATSRLSAGRLLYLLWHAPRAAVAYRNRQGWLNVFLAERGRRAMELAARRLQPLAAPNDDAREIWFLTGSRFWQQTVFCAYSLTRSAGATFRFVLVDDGTLTTSEQACLRNILTGCRIVTPHEIEAALDRLLPASQFPVLRRRRLVYPHLRKLTDVHTQGGGWKLVLDSDMLFHARPDTILQWLAAPAAPLYMRDIASAYGYSDALLQELAGGSPAACVNVGVCGLNSAEMDWARLETWCRILLEREGGHYLQEQALTAMLIGDRGIEIPGREGIVCPARAEVMRPTASLHHYVAESKAWYFRFAWRRIQGDAKSLDAA